MNRQSSSTGGRWDRKLAAYAAGAAAVLAAQDAQAAIIYSGVQNIPVGLDSTVEFDMDGDGVGELQFENVFDAINSVRRLEVSGLGNKYVQHPLASGVPWDMPVGTLIDGNQKYAEGPGTMAQSDGLFQWGVGAGGTGILGLVFEINPIEVHYGWVRVTVDPTDATAVIQDWAYSDIPERGVYAGLLQEVPEPGTLALLALGAAGVGAFRARRRQTAANADTL